MCHSTSAVHSPRLAVASSSFIRLPISDELGLVAYMNVVNIHAVYRLACFSIRAALELLLIRV